MSENKEKMTMAETDVKAEAQVRKEKLKYLIAVTVAAVSMIALAIVILTFWGIPAMENKKHPILTSNTDIFYSENFSVRTGDDALAPESCADIHTTAKGTATVYNKSREMFGIRLIAEISIYPGENNRIEFVFPSGSEIKSVYTNYPNNTAGEDDPNGELYYSTYVWGKQNARTYVKVGVKDGETYSAGGEGIILIEAEFPKLEIRNNLRYERTNDRISILAWGNAEGIRENWAYRDRTINLDPKGWE